MAEVAAAERDHAHVAAEPRGRAPRWPTSGRRPRPPASILLDLSTTLPDGNRAHRRPAGGERPPLRRGAAHRRRHRRPEPRRSCSWSAATTSRCAAACRSSTSSGRATFHLGPVGTGTTMKLANSLLALACTWASFESLSLRRQGRHRPAHRGRGRSAPPASSNFYIDRGVEGINTRGQAAAVHPRAGGQGRRPHQRDRRRHRRARRDRRGGARRCSTTPSPAASATTTGPTSCSPPRREPASSSTCRRRRRRPDVAPRRHRGRLLHRPRRPGRAAPPARQPVPGLRRGTSSRAGCVCAQCLHEGMRRRRARPARPALHLDLRARAAVRQEGRRRSTPTASARSTCPRARGCRRSSSAAPTTSRIGMELELDLETLRHRQGRQRRRDLPLHGRVGARAGARREDRGRRRSPGSGWCGSACYPDRSDGRPGPRRRAGRAARRRHDAGRRRRGVRRLRPAGVDARRQGDEGARPHRAAGHPHRERVGHRAGRVPRGGVGGGVGSGRGGHGDRLRQDDRHGRRRAPSRGTGRDQLDATILPGRLLRAVGAAAHARPRHHARALRRHRRQELEPRRARARGATASPTTRSPSRRCSRRGWSPSRSPR